MGDIIFQRGQVDVTNGSTQAITAVSSLDNSFTLLNNNRNSSGGPNGSTSNQSSQTMGLGVEMTSTSQLTFRKDNATTVRANWETWEYVGAPGGVHEFIVRDRVVATLDGTGNTFAVSNVVDPDKCVCFVTGATSTLAGQTTYSITANAYLSNATTLTVAGQRGSGTTTVYVTVVEFTGTAWTVGHGTLDTGNDTGTINLVEGSDGTTGSAVTVNWSNAFIYAKCRAGDTTNVALADHFPVMTPNTTSSVTLTYNANHDGTHTHFVDVIENSSVTVTRITNSVSHTGAQNVSIASAGLTDISTATSFISRTSSGTGTAYGRGWVSSRLTSTTNLEMYCHRNGNTINTNIQVVDMSGLAVIGITDVDGDDQFLATETDIIITGFGFGATQGTGKVEIWDDTSGTTKVVQSIDSWSDTSIQFDATMGSISDQATRYIVITNDNADVSATYAVFVGIPPLDTYQVVLTGLSPDHRWQLNNDGYADTGAVGASPMTNSVQGDGGSFELTPLCEGVTHSWLADNRVAREAPDNDQMNLQAKTARTMGGWYQINQIAKDLSCIYKEGGSVNNVCFFVGMGNTLIAQMADTGDDNVQAYSDFKLEVGRSYHIVWRFDYSESPAEFRLYIDGRLQTVTAGNPLTSTDLDSHSGDIIWAGLDTSVEVAGTDVTFTNQESANYNEWVTWEIALTEAVILNSLFRRGAIPELTVASGTPVAMQTSLDGLADTAVSNAPLGIRIETPSGADDLSLTADNIVFNEDITEFLEWRGAGTLTWTNINGSNLTADKWFATRGGSVVIVNPATLTLTGLQNPTEVRVYEAGTTTEIAGEENVTTGTFSATIQTSTVDIVIVALDYQNIRLTSIDTSADITLPIQQRFDRYYDNP